MYSVLIVRELSSFQGYHNRVSLNCISLCFLGLSDDDTNFIQATAVIVILFSIIQFVLESMRFIRKLHILFADFGTWVKVPLFIFTIIFAAVFNRECFCPRDWQWQIGIAAVFLVWVHLILYMRRMTVLGKNL